MDAAVEVRIEGESLKTVETFNVDKTKIKRAHFVDDNLSNLGIVAYGQDDFEQGVLDQIEEACSSKTTEDQPSTSSAQKGDAKSRIYEESNVNVRFGDATPFEVQGNEIFDDKCGEFIDDDVEYKPDTGDVDYQPSDANDSDSDLELEQESCNESNVPKVRIKKAKASVKKIKTFVSSLDKSRDDGMDKYYEERIKSHKRRKLELTLERVEKTGLMEEDEVELTGGLLIPSTLWSKLFKYQRTGVRWMWELHRQSVGGIMGDEMGLGKTIQVIAFLGALAHSNLENAGFGFKGLGSTLILCPTTVMHQWVRELHKWWPEFRVAVLHDSGSHVGPRHRLISKINKLRGILITSYSTLTVERETILKHEWHYVILDEGHKIRNPDAQVTLASKQIRTPHRIILTGTPMQNSLKELWSLFDFVFPGRLGSLPDFIREFGIPITQGGYANASPVQVQTAYKCACVLRETISPYLLRRTKADVKTTVNLPNKSEQVLFCRLTDVQREVYKQYLTSRECDSILKGRLEAFVGLIALRKLCNHPDLVTGGPNRLGDLDESSDPSSSFGHYKRSGKMIVVEALLKLWKRQEHRILLFSQSRQMLNVLERFLKMEQMTYMRMDGSTPIGSRQTMVSRFNEDASLFCFLLTTRVGGLGLNLIGADRVLIYDPDWNPSTDCQARERAWRIGQTRPVTVYRLLTTGTIEEKIYHRQIFKQFLTNRILKNPKQSRFFKTNDLFELFTLTDEKNTETSTLFAGTGSEVTLSRSDKKASKRRNIFDELAKERKNANALTAADEEDIDYVPDDESEKVEDDPEKLDKQRATELRDLARKLSKELAECKEDVRKKSKRKKHKRERKAKEECTMDGIVIPLLAKQAEYKPGSKMDDDSNEELRSKEHDDYVLNKLLKNSKVHSALKHDKIVESGSTDGSLVEKEAENVAKQAVKALAASRKLCHNATSGIPTWTGKNGAFVVPRFGKKRKTVAQSKTKPKNSTPLFGGVDLISNGSTVKDHQPISSSDLLTSIRRRKGLKNNSDSEEDRRDSDVVIPPPKITKLDTEIAGMSSVSSKYVGVLTELRHFIAFGSKLNGRAATEEILSRFGSRVALQDSAVFKSLLNKICTFTRLNSGEGVWILKNEFR